MSKVNIKLSPTSAAVFFDRSLRKMRHLQATLLLTLLFGCSGGNESGDKQIKKALRLQKTCIYIAKIMGVSYEYRADYEKCALILGESKKYGSRTYESNTLYSLEGEGEIVGAKKILSIRQKQETLTSYEECLIAQKVKSDKVGYIQSVKKCAKKAGRSIYSYGHTLDGEDIW